MVEIKVLTDILGRNEAQAAENRKRCDAAGVACVNIMGSPGAGKTALLEGVLRAGNAPRIGVLEGDVSTTADAERLAALGAPVVQINTDRFGGACHLSAAMVGAALPSLPLAELDLVVVENIGNLICPCEFDLGEHRRVVVASVAEGAEKPLKYPLMFRKADLVVVNKIDLGASAADAAEMRDNVLRVNPAATVLPASARTGEGLDAWTGWLRSLAP
jgi:hydrogenase nickel incorporation protein HypB